MKRRGEGKDMKGMRGEERGGGEVRRGGERR